MAGRAETLFAQLQGASAVRALIGEAEDAYLDCKEWPTKEDDAQKMIAKAVCGLANADGGVLVIGMKAAAKPKDEPDVVTAEASVSDTSLVKSRLLGLISNLVEPGIVGLEAVEIADKPHSKSGFVVVYIPTSEGPPVRSRKDWKFYLRNGSATLPMEFRQIQDRFGARPHARLLLFCSQPETRPQPMAFGIFQRIFRLIVKNEGRGLARFPAIRCEANSGFFHVNTFVQADQSVWQFINSNDGWFSFRGGANDVIYPGETLTIATLAQHGTRVNDAANSSTWKFSGAAIRLEVVCEGMAAHGQTFEVAEDIFDPA